VAAVHEVLGSLALETPVNCHSELIEDSLGTSSQCSSEWSRCVKLRSNFPVLLTTRAAAFSKRCNLSVMALGDPANTVLQPSMRDVMKACTRVFTDSASSDWLNWLAEISADLREVVAHQRRLRAIQIHVLYFTTMAATFLS